MNLNKGLLPLDMVCVKIMTDMVHAKIMTRYSICGYCGADGRYGLRIFFILG